MDSRQELLDSLSTDELLKVWRELGKEYRRRQMNDRAERGQPLSLLFGLFGEETPIERVRRRSA